MRKITVCRGDRVTTHIVHREGWKEYIWIGNRKVYLSPDTTALIVEPITYH